MPGASHSAVDRDTYIHHVPGRLRVRSSLIRRNHSRANEAVESLRPLAGVHSAEANPLTGSLTLRYDPSVMTGDALLVRLKEGGWIPLGPVLPSAAATTPVAWLGSETSAKVAKAVAIYALEKVAERSLAALIAAVL